MPLTKPTSLIAVLEELSRKEVTKNQTMRKAFLMIREFRAPDSFEKHYPNIQEADAHNIYFV